MKVNRLNVKGWGVWYTYGRGVLDMLISPVLKVPFVEGGCIVDSSKNLAFSLIVNIYTLNKTFQNYWYNVY